MEALTEKCLDIGYSWGVIEKTSQISDNWRHADATTVWIRGKPCSPTVKTNTTKIQQHEEKELSEAQTGDREIHYSKKVWSIQIIWDGVLDGA